VPRLTARVAIAGLVVLAAGGAFAWSSFQPHSIAPLAPPPAAHAQVVRHIPPAVTGKTRVRPKHYQLVVHAVGASCWVLARRGGAGGPVLYVGTLAPGKTLRFSPRVWLRLGAPTAVRVYRGQERWHWRTASPVDLTA